MSEIEGERKIDVHSISPSYQISVQLKSSFFLVCMFQTQISKDMLIHTFYQSRFLSSLFYYSLFLSLSLSFPLFLSLPLSFFKTFQYSNDNTQMTKIQSSGESQKVFESSSKFIVSAKLELGKWNIVLSIIIKKNLKFGKLEKNINT